MVHIREVIAELTILARYGDNQVFADRGMIYAGDTRAEEMVADDERRLKELGWGWCPEYESWCLVAGDD